MTCDLQASLFWQTQHFQEGQAQVADAVQEAMQGGLIDDLPDQDGLIRLLPAQAESAEPGRPLRPQLALHANTVAGGHAQHGAAPLLPGIRWSALRAPAVRLRTRARRDQACGGFCCGKPPWRCWWGCLRHALIIALLVDPPLGIDGLALLLAQKAEGREPQRDGQDDEEEDEDDSEHGDHTMLLLVGRALPHLYVPRCAPFGEGHREVLLTGKV